MALTRAASSLVSSSVRPETVRRYSFSFCLPLSHSNNNYKIK